MYGSVTWGACWSDFSTAIYRNVANVQAAAASCTGEIPSCLDTNPSSSIGLSSSGSSNSVQLSLTLDTAVSYRQVQERLLLVSGALEAVKMSKMYIYTYYLLITTQLSFKLYVVTRYLFLTYIADSHDFAKLCYIGQHWMTDTWVGAHRCKL